MSNLVWFYCDNCFKTEMKDLREFQKAAESLTGFEWNKKGMFASLHGLICPHCGCHHSTFQIDFQMIPVVRGLNEKGYITKACCSGHEDSNCFHYESDEAYIFIEFSHTLANYLSVVKTLGFGEVTSFVDFEVEVAEGSGVYEEMNGICIRAKFKDTVSEEDRKARGAGFLAISLFTAIVDFPENDDKFHLILKKYSYCHEDGTPYTDKKEVTKDE